MLKWIFFFLISDLKLDPIYEYGLNLVLKELYLKFMLRKILGEVYKIEIFSIIEKFLK